MHCAIRLMVIIIGHLTIASCSSDTNPPGDGPRDAALDPTCSSQSEDVERVDLPAGRCVAHAECRFNTGAGLSFCHRTGSGTAPVTPNRYHCTCPNGEWGCELTGGGLGVEPCPDGG